jgi:type I restriction enzyme, S subunit
MIEDLKPYPEMKDSGEPGLGCVPKHWEVLPLCAIAKPRKVINQEHLELLSVYLGRGVIPFSAAAEKRTNPTSDDLSKYQAVEPGDFVLNNQQAWRGSVGVSRYKGIVSPAYLVLTLDGRLYREFADRLFSDRGMVAQYVVSSRGVGSIQRNLYWPHLKRVATLVPPASEQSAIVRFLNHADAYIRRYISAKQKVIKLLEEERQAIIHRTVTRGLDPNVPLKPSGVEWLGEVPEHWEVGRVGRLFVQRNEVGFGTLPILEVSLRTGVRVRAFGGSERKQIMSDREKYKRACKGDIAYNMMRMWQGAVGVAPCDGLISPAYVVARPIAGTIPEYFTELFRTTEFMAEVDRNSKGIVKDRNRLYWEDFKRIVVAYPPPEEQSAIVAGIRKRTEILDQGVELTERELAVVRELRTRMVADVVTGKLDVREAAAKLPEIAPETEPLGETDDLAQDEELAEAAELEVEDAA